MTAQQIVDNCRDIALRLFPEQDAAGQHARALCEIQLLRTKVFELAMRLENARAPAETGAAS